MQNWMKTKANFSVQAHTVHFPTLDTEKKCGCVEFHTLHDEFLTATHPVICM